MLRAEVLEAVIETLLVHRPTEAPAAPPREEDRLEDLGLSSGEVVEVILDLEDRYGIVIDATEISRTSTVGEVADYVRGKAAALRAPGGA